MSAGRLPRLLILVNAFEADAPTRLLLEVARAVQASGRFECHMAALSRGGPLMEEARAVLAGAHNLAMGRWRSLAGRRRLAGFLRTLGPAIVHVSLLRPTLIGVPAARLARVPHVAVTCHGTHEWREARPFPEWLIRHFYVRAARAADAVIGVSGAVRDELINAGVPRTQTRVIYNGLNPEAGGSELLQTLPPEGGSPNGIVIGSAGNLRSLKGFETLIHAAALLCRNGEKAGGLKVRIWGDGPERERLQRLIDETGAPVRLEGRCPDLPRLLAKCDLYVQPSLREAFGLAAAEAMACGVPVIVSDAGGLPEVTGRGADAAGLVFPAGSARSLADCLERLLNDRELRRNLASNARRRVLEHFTLDRMTAGYMALYDELLTRRELR